MAMDILVNKDPNHPSSIFSTASCALVILEVRKSSAYASPGTLLDIPHALVNQCILNRKEDMLRAHVSH
jgi:hypothetical protein